MSTYFPITHIRWKREAAGVLLMVGLVTAVFFATSYESSAWRVTAYVMLAGSGMHSFVTLGKCSQERDTTDVPLYVYSWHTFHFGLGVWATIKLFQWSAPWASVALLWAFIQVVAMTRKDEKQEKKTAQAPAGLTWN